MTQRKHSAQENSAASGVKQNTLGALADLEPAREVGIPSASAATVDDPGACARVAPGLGSGPGPGRPGPIRVSAPATPPRRDCRDRRDRGLGRPGTVSWRNGPA